MLLPFLFLNFRFHKFTIDFFPSMTYVRASQRTYLLIWGHPRLIGEKFRCDVASSACIPKMGYTFHVADAVLSWTILDTKVRILPVFVATRIRAMI